MTWHINQFLHDESGVVTVDWTVLSAAAVGMAIAATAIVTGAIENLGGRMDAELRSRQLNDDFVGFTPAHWEPLYEVGFITEEQSQVYFDEANELFNDAILTTLEEGIIKLEEGTISPEEFVDLIAAASVAYQRNIVDDEVLNYYFGFDGVTEPYYVTALAAGPVSTY